MEIDIAIRIGELADELAKAKNVVKQRADEKAIAKSNYDKAIALTILKLKNGVIREWEGLEINAPAVTLIESIAKGICWAERLEMERTEGLYKSALTYIEVTTTQIQGYQSIFKHLDNV